MHILITGASSGLGAALALHYAAPGCILSLLGRNRERLQAIAAACMQRGAVVEHATIDVCDAPAMAQWLVARDTETPVQLVIANAGISGGSSGLAGESAEQATALFATNLNGVLNTIHPLLPAMRARASGQIAIISSLAGFRGLPSAPAYSASKMAVRGYGEALRGLLAADGVRVTVVCPGYIRTPLTDINTFPMPGIMSADAAAALIAKGVAANRSRIVFPFWFGTMCWLLSALPPRFTDWIYARLPKK
jgi:short-subunit dehydrogenase